MPVPLATIWNESGWTDFYESHRRRTSDMYPSEWLFLEKHLRQGISVLDIGCAVGGLASVFEEHVGGVRYTGVDLSESMVARARAKHPRHRFEVIPEADLSVLGDETFDLVTCLGVMHLTRRWRDLLDAAWRSTGRALLFDLRETSGATIEDESSSYYAVEALLGTGAAGRLPYNIINTAEALGIVLAVCDDAAQIEEHGYLAPVSGAAVTPLRRVLMHTYHVLRPTP